MAWVSSLPAQPKPRAAHSPRNPLPSDFSPLSSPSRGSGFSPPVARSSRRRSPPGGPTAARGRGPTPVAARRRDHLRRAHVVEEHLSEPATTRGAGAQPTPPARPAPPRTLAHAQPPSTPTPTLLPVTLPAPSLARGQATRPRDGHFLTPVRGPSPAPRLRSPSRPSTPPTATHGGPTLTRARGAATTAVAAAPAAFTPRLCGARAEIFWAPRRVEEHPPHDPGRAKDPRADRRRRPLHHTHSPPLSHPSHPPNPPSPPPLTSPFPLHPRVATPTPATARPPSGGHVWCGYVLFFTVYVSFVDAASPPHTPRELRDRPRRAPAPPAAPRRAGRRRAPHHDARLGSAISRPERSFQFLFHI